MSTALLQGNITMTNNSGLTGEEWLCNQVLSLFLILPLALQVSNNSVTMFGGGIYVSQKSISFATSFLVISSFVERKRETKEERKKERKT